MVETLQAGKVTQADREEADFITKTLLYKTIAERDKKIRYAQTCDRIAFLMLKDWFSGSGLTIDTATLTLNDCFLPPNLNRQIDPFARQSFLDKPFEMEIQVSNKTITANLPLYRYGEFRRIVKDKRVAGTTDSLVSWYSVDTIALDRIKTEIKHYNEHRHEVLGAIIDMEKRFVADGKVDIHEKDDNGADTDVLLDYVSHPNYLFSLVLSLAAQNELKQLCKTIIAHTDTVYQTRTSNQRPLGLRKQDIEAYIAALPIPTELLITDFITKISDRTDRFYSNMNAVKPIAKQEEELYEVAEKFFKHQNPTIAHLNMLRNKFAHNQIRYDTTTNIPPSDATDSLITAQLIKYTKEQYEAL
jgi:hypothetical protein